MIIAVSNDYLIVMAIVCMCTFVNFCLLLSCWMLWPWSMETHIQAPVQEAEPKSVNGNWHFTLLGHINCQRSCTCSCTCTCVHAATPQGSWLSLHLLPTDQLVTRVLVYICHPPFPNVCSKLPHHFLCPPTSAAAQHPHVRTQWRLPHQPCR